MAEIYEQHDVAFKSVSAYVIVKGGERVATVAFKFPKDGAGRLYAYVHWLGTEMVRGHAGGFGYDKRSAAVASAAKSLKPPANTEFLVANETNPGLHLWKRFVEEIAKDDGYYWDHRLRNAGFEVWQAV